MIIQMICKRLIHCQLYAKLSHGFPKGNCFSPLPHSFSPFFLGRSLTRADPCCKHLPSKLWQSFYAWASGMASQADTCTFQICIFFAPLLFTERTHTHTHTTYILMTKSLGFCPSLSQSTVRSNWVIFQLSVFVGITKTSINLCGSFFERFSWLGCIANLQISQFLSQVNERF